MFTPDEYYNIVEFTGAGTRRDEVVEEIQQQHKCTLWYSYFVNIPVRHAPLKTTRTFIG